MLRLKTIKLLRESVVRWDEYPFNIPPIASLDALEITSRICFFDGENGSGAKVGLSAGEQICRSSRTLYQRTFSDKPDSE